MTRSDKAYQIVTYLADLANIRKEHVEAVENCPDCADRVKAGETGPCYLIAVINVEIVTYERKLGEIV